MAQPAAAELAAEVYRDDSIIIRAGLQGSSNQYLYFGDVLVLLIAVTYDPDSVSIQEIDAAFFTSAWPVDRGAHLIDSQTRYDDSSESRLSSVHAIFGFQILGCPDDETPTCPGNRTYAWPDFTLGYEDLNASGDPARSVTFRPWPETLTVSTTLQRDEEDQLFPFETYFPAGGYPDPLVGQDGLLRSVLTAGIALAFLMGGILMWPFRSRTQDKAAVNPPRWQKQLELLRAADAQDDAAYLDALRRCLVWYCNDELQLDPFVWLDLAEPGDNAADDQNDSELRSLFMDLLHSPVGQGVELRQRLEKIVSAAGAA